MRWLKPVDIPIDYELRARMIWEEPTYFSDFSRKHTTRWTSLTGRVPGKFADEDALVDLKLTEDDVVLDVCVWEDIGLFTRKFKKSLIGKPMKEAQALITTALTLEGFK